MTSKHSLLIIKDMKDWLPEDIRAFRKRHSLYQKDFAELLGVTREYLVYLEGGVKRPSKTLKLLLDCIEREKNKRRRLKTK